MLKSMKKNKQYILGMVTIGLFGIAGLLLVPVVMYIIKLLNRYPKAFKWVFFTVFAFICIYGFLFEREWDTRIAIIYIWLLLLAVSSILNTNSR